MGNAIELRQLVKNILNTNCVDPFPRGNTRRGNQFFDEADQLNMTRRDTFPKGYLKVSSPPSGNIKSAIGRTGWIKKYATISIYYYNKEDGTYSTYKNQDLVHYMLNEIQTTLLNYRFADYYLSENAFDANPEVDLLNNGSFKIYASDLTVTFYWYEEYGS